MKAILKFFVLTIFTSICLIGLTNQQAPSRNVQAQLNKALDEVVAGQCWKKQDLQGLTFSETNTRRAQAPTPKVSCNDTWAHVQSLWQENNQLVDKFNQSFAKAMDQVKVCKSRRRLQAAKKPECKQAQIVLEQESWEQLRKLLQDRAKTEALVNSANAVVVTHNVPTIQDEDANVMADHSWNLLVGPLKGVCQAENKLMELVISSSRRAQKPTPKPDPVCQKALEDVVGYRKRRVTQVNSLLLLSLIHI